MTAELVCSAGALEAVLASPVGPVDNRSRQAVTSCMLEDCRERGHHGNHGC